ncbi:M24 family metallopeptidase [Amphiplicatus metriothermophilus]|uniref:M24 family metallopeptidase n=1 Tax=Amphiplicatus metriothermophilus TaxID=1519374 RepID=UPI00190EE9B0
MYHRPAHGEGTEGHQPPWLALGDETILDPGMCFSVEPGLFDSETGIGSNFSDMFAVMPEGPALQMSRLPWSEEWSFIDILSLHETALLMSELPRAASGG